MIEQIKRRAKKEMMQEVEAASIIFAAGYGSRMRGFLLEIFQEGQRLW